MTNLINLFVLTLLVSCGNASLFDGKLKAPKSVDNLTQTQAPEQADNNQDQTDDECLDGYQYIENEKVICDKREYIKCHEGECVDGVAYINGEIVLCDSYDNEFRVIDEIKCVGKKCKQKFEDIDSYESTRVIKEKRERNSDWDFEANSNTRQENTPVQTSTNSNHNYEGNRVENNKEVRKTNTSSSHNSYGKRNKAPKKQAESNYTSSDHNSNGHRNNKPEESKVHNTSLEHNSNGRKNKKSKQKKPHNTTSTSYDSNGQKNNKKSQVINVVMEKLPVETNSNHEYNGRKVETQKTNKRKSNKLNVGTSWEPCKSGEYRHHGKCLKKKSPVRNTPKIESRVSNVKPITPTTRPQPRTAKLPKNNNTTKWVPCKSDEYRHHGKCLKKKSPVRNTPKIESKVSNVKSTTPTTKPQPKTAKLPKKNNTNKWVPCKSDEYRHHGKCLKKKSPVRNTPKIESKVSNVKSTTPTTRPQPKTANNNSTKWVPCKSDEYRHHGKCLKKKSPVRNTPKIESKVSNVKSTTPTTRPQPKTANNNSTKWVPCKSDEYRHHGKCLKKKSPVRNTPKIESKINDVKSTTPTTMPQPKTVDLPKENNTKKWEACKSDEYRHHGECLKKQSVSNSTPEVEPKQPAQEVKTEVVSDSTPCASDEYRHHGKCLKMNKNAKVEVIVEEKPTNNKLECGENEYLKDGKCVKSKDKKKASKEIADIFKTKGLTDMGELPAHLKECISTNAISSSIDFENPLFSKEVLKLNNEEITISSLSSKHKNVFTLELKNKNLTTLKADRYHSEDFIMEALAVDYELEGMGEKELKVLKVTSLHNSSTRDAYIVLSKDGLHAIGLFENNKQVYCSN